MTAQRRASARAEDDHPRALYADPDAAERGYYGVTPDGPDLTLAGQVKAARTERD